MRKKRTLSIILSLIMILSLLPGTAQGTGSSRLDTSEGGYAQIRTFDQPFAASELEGLEIRAVDGKNYLLDEISQETVVLVLGRTTCGFTMGVVRAAYEASQKDEDIQVIFLCIDNRGAPTEKEVAAQYPDLIVSDNFDANQKLSWALQSACSVNSTVLPGCYVLDQDRKILLASAGEEGGFTSGYLKNFLQGGSSEDPQDDPERKSTVTVSVSGDQKYGLAYEVIEQLNDLRRSVGEEPLTADGALMDAAMQRAAELSLDFSHTRPNGEECFSLFPDSSHASGENIAYGQSTSAGVMSSWTNSPGHYGNMINGTYTNVGVGCFYANGTYHWVQTFSSGPNHSHSRLTDRSAVVSVEIPAESYSPNLTPEQIVLETGEQTTLTLRVGPDFHNAPIQAKISSVSCPAFVTLDQDSLTLTAEEAGEGTLSLTLETGEQLSISVAVSDPTPPPPVFFDVDMDMWYAEGILYAVENGLMNGVSVNLFDPNGATTRAMVVTILHRLEGAPEAALSGFTDLAWGSWYHAAVNWAVEQGVVYGIGENLFGPDQPITREQLAAMLYRYADFKGYDVYGRGNTEGFADADQISPYAQDPVAWAVDAALIQGVGGGLLNPGGSATRAQIATVLMRFCETIAAS